MYIILGWIIATLGAIGLVASVTLEILLGEPMFLLFAKLSAGILGIGGIVLALTRKK